MVIKKLVLKKVFYLLFTPVPQRMFYLIFKPVLKRVFYLLFKPLPQNLFYLLLISVPQRVFYYYLHPFHKECFTYYLRQFHKTCFIYYLYQFRGISLLPTTYKVLPNILLSRLIPHAEEVIGDHQGGFRRNRSTTDHVFCIRQILEKKWEYNEAVHQLFIDFKKARICLTCFLLGMVWNREMLCRHCFSTLFWSMPGGFRWTRMAWN
jgi:hypothetical protein